MCSFDVTLELMDYKEGQKVVIKPGTYNITQFSEGIHTVVSIRKTHPFRSDEEGTYALENTHNYELHPVSLKFHQCCL